MLNKIKESIPLICSAYAGALLMYFLFIYKGQIDQFVYINLMVFAFWSTYAWFVVWAQNGLIDRMSRVMISVANKIEKLAAVSEAASKEAEKD